MAAGIFSQFNFGMESQYGVRVPATHIAEVSDGSGINFNLDLQAVEVVNGQLAKNVCTYPGQADTSGTIEMPFFPATVPYFLKSLFGEVETSEYQQGGSTVSGVYQHVFSESAERPTMTIEETIGDLPRLATGFQPNQMTLTIDNEGLINTSFEGFAKAISILSNPTTGATASLGCPMHHADNITITIDGVPFATLQSLELIYNNNVTPEYTITAGSSVGFRGIGRTEYSGSMTMILDSTAPAEYQKYLESQSRNIQVAVSGATIGTSGVSQQLLMSMPSVKFSNFEVNATMETVTADVEFMGLFDKTNNEHITLTVINEVSTLDN